jgi:hypothetical protein
VSAPMFQGNQLTDELLWPDGTEHSV